MGDTISRILEWNGYQVDREYYFNNAGRQMRKLGESVRARYLNICNVDSSFPDDGYQVNILMKLQNHFKMNLAINILVKIILISLKILLNRKYLKISKDLRYIKISFDNFFNEDDLYKDKSIDRILSDLSEKN